MIKQLEIYRGDTCTVLCTVTRNRVAFDLTDYSAVMTVKHKYTDVDSLAVFTKIGIIDSPTAGILRIELGETETDIEEKSYVYDIKIYKEDKSDIKTILTGVFKVNSVARREIPSS